jgi:hypothetical protein
VFGCGEDRHVLDTREMNAGGRVVCAVERRRARDCADLTLSS